MSKTVSTGAGASTGAAVSTYAYQQPNMANMGSPMSEEGES